MRFIFTLLAVLLPLNIFGATNLLENSSFEAGDLRGWSQGAYSTSLSEPVSFTNLYVQHGSKSLRIQTQATGSIDANTSQFKWGSRLYRLKPSTQYTLSGYVKGQWTVSPFYASSIFTVRNSRDGLPSPASINLATGTNYERYSLTFTTTTNEGQCTYQIQISVYGQGSPAGNFIHVDSLQLEEGTNATAYAPMTPVEIGCQIDRSTPGHVYYSDETPLVKLAAFNNTASSSNILENWRLYDYWNVLRASGTKTITALANTTTVDSVSFTITGKTNGWYRFIAWVDGIPESQTEACFGIVPRPISVGDRTNGMFGIETYPSAWYLGAEQRLGFHWSRNLSVFPWGRWNVAQPATNTWVFFTNQVALNRAYDIEPLGQIGNGQGLDGIPAYALDTNVVFDTLWSNFVSAIVTEYKPFVKYWEIWNESGVGAYSNVLKTAAIAARLADTSAIIVAPAHAYFLEVSNIVQTLGTSYLDIWSSHLYPGAEHGGASGATSIGIDGTIVALNHFGYTEGWNTETGLRMDTAHQLALREENQFTPAVSPAGWGFYRNRHGRVPVQMRNLFGSLIGPFKKYFYYDGRNTGGHDGYIAFSIFEYDNTIGPMGVALAAAINLREGGTNGAGATLSSFTDSYTWMRSNRVYFAIFPTNILEHIASDKLAISSSEAGTVFYDFLGNRQTGTVLFGREHIIVEGGIGVSSNTLATSLTLYKTNDISAPNLSINTFPTATNQTRFTWRVSAFDDTCFSTEEIVEESAIKYAFKLVGVDSDYTAWTNLSWVTYTNLNPNSTYTMNLKAKDAAGNISTIAAETILRATTLNFGGIEMAQ